MVLWISKMQFWHQCRKNFAKTQIIFCSKSGNVSKKLLSFANFLSSQMKLLSTYVEGSVDNRAENSSSKTRNFFWFFLSNSKSDKQLKNFFKKNYLLKMFACTRRTHSWENSEKIFEVKLPAFNAHISKRFKN